MLNLIKKVVGTKNEREIKRIRPIVEEISALEPEFQKLTDAELRAKTDEFKNRIKAKTADLQTAVDEAQARALAAPAEEREELKGEAEKLETQLRETVAEALD